MRFRATVELGGRTATGFEVPDEVVERLGSGKRPPVTVTVNGHTYRSTIARMGGRYLLPLSAENRTAANVGAGDEVDAEVELDTAPRIVEVPNDLAAALAVEPAARERWDRLSYSHQRQHVLAIDEAKTDATRQRRITKAIDMLTADR